MGTTNRAEELAKELSERLEGLCEGLAISGDSPSKETILNYFNELNNYRQSEIDELKQMCEAQNGMLKELCEQLDKSTEEVERLRKENEKIKFFTDNNIDISKVLRFDTPYPIHEVLKGLTECADVLLHEKAYDRAGWERLEYCYQHGIEIIKSFNHPLTTKNK